VSRLYVRFPVSNGDFQAYAGVDGKPRLFRPDMNMARLARSAERVALPVSALCSVTYELQSTHKI
jgi:branched-subunit amino acid aminotransferase/4-amino-4-deoxychorismate lyase